MNPFTKLSRLNWFFLLVSGFVMTLFLGSLYRHFNPPLDPTLVHAAHTAGIEPALYNELEQLTFEADAKGTLSDSKWQHLKDVYDRQPKTRHDVLSVMECMTRSPHRKEIIELAHHHLQNGPKELRVVSLQILWRMHTPDWRDVANDWLKNSTDDWEKESAATMLARGEVP